MALFSVLQYMKSAFTLYSRAVEEGYVLVVMCSFVVIPVVMLLKLCSVFNHNRLHYHASPVIVKFTYGVLNAALLSTAS